MILFPNFSRDGHHWTTVTLIDVFAFHHAVHFGQGRTPLGEFSGFQYQIAVSDALRPVSDAQQSFPAHGEPVLGWW